MSLASFMTSNRFHFDKNTLILFRNYLLIYSIRKYKKGIGHIYKMRSGNIWIFFLYNKIIEIIANLCYIFVSRCSVIHLCDSKLWEALRLLWHRLQSGALLLRAVTWYHKKKLILCYDRQIILREIATLLFRFKNVQYNYIYFFVLT